jgi:hypothetical protein
MERDHLRSCLAFSTSGITLIPACDSCLTPGRARGCGQIPSAIGFEEVQEIFSHPYYLDERSDLPDQHRAIGWVGERLYTVIFEVREDQQGEYFHLVTLWKSTREERTLYEEHS